MRFNPIVLVVFIVLFASSCRTQRAVYNYLEDVTDTSFRKGVFLAETRIQKSDLLYIQVYSASLDPQVDALYNIPQQMSAGGGGGSTSGGGGGQSGQGGQLGGYLVDINGNIDMPRIGAIRAEGLTKGELEAVIKTKLEGGGHLTSPG